MWEILFKYWHIIGLIIITAIIYYRSLKTSNEIDKTNLKFYFWLCIIMITVFGIQIWFFPEHYYLLISMIIFVPVWIVVIYYLLSRDDVYILESTIQGETFYDIRNLKKIVADNTSQRLLVMPREIYDSKIHVGDLHYGFWAGSTRIKFCDKYDDETGIFYHPAIQQLHNYTFYAIKSFWIKLKRDLPEIIDQNTVLTLMSDWYVSFKMFNIKENTREHLKSINVQHENAPFVMPENLESLFEKAMRDKMRDVADTEKPKPDSDKTKKSEPAKPDSKPDGDSNE